jgi:hypothetical protein
MINTYKSLFIFLIIKLFNTSRWRWFRGEGCLALVLFAIPTISTIVDDIERLLICRRSDLANLASKLDFAPALALGKLRVIPFLLFSCPAVTRTLFSLFADPWIALLVRGS